MIQYLLKECNILGVGMNIEPDDNQTTNISDDQELAKALAGVNNIIETPEPEPETMPPQTQAPAATPMSIDMSEKVEETTPEVNTSSTDLGLVKGAAIQELRPLIGKLVLPADEKFDTYLLLIRSTDDETLIPPAHETAKMIEDEGRRAMALLDIIKEIDYLTNRTNAPSDDPSGR